MLEIDEILTKRLEAKTLAHFYIVHGNTRETVKGFGETLLTKFYNTLVSPEQRSSDILKLGHPDILVFEKEDEKDYLIGNKDLDEFFKFVEMSPVKLPWRFIFLYDTHKITESYANKLLKTLESPGQRISIFFFHHTGTKLLPTVEGRAIKIQLPRIKNTFTVSEKVEQTLQRIKNRQLSSKGIAECIDAIKLKPELQNELLLGLLDIERNELDQYQGKSNILELLPKFDKYKTFHNSSASRLFLLLQQFKNI